MTVLLFCFFFFRRQLLKSRSDAELGQAASCSPAALPLCGGGAHQKDPSSRVGTSFSCRVEMFEGAGKRGNCLPFSLQGLHLLLRDMSSPLDMDCRRQLLLQNKGDALLELTLVNSQRSLFKKQYDFFFSCNLQERQFPVN